MGTGENGTGLPHPLENFMLDSFIANSLKWFLARITVHPPGLETREGSLSWVRVGFTEPSDEHLGSRPWLLRTRAHAAPSADSAGSVG